MRLSVCSAFPYSSNDIFKHSSLYAALAWTSCGCCLVDDRRRGTQEQALRHWASGKGIVASAWEPRKGSLRRLVLTWLVVASGSESRNMAVSAARSCWVLHDASLLNRFKLRILVQNHVFRLYRRIKGFETHICCSECWTKYHFSRIQKRKPLLYLSQLHLARVHESYYFLLLYLFHRQHQPATPPRIYAYIYAFVLMNSYTV